MAIEPYVQHLSGQHRFVEVRNIDDVSVIAEAYCIASGRDKLLGGKGYSARDYYRVIFSRQCTTKDKVPIGSQYCAFQTEVRGNYDIWVEESSRNPVRPNSRERYELAIEAVARELIQSGTLGDAEAALLKQYFERAILPDDPDLSPSAQKYIDSIYPDIYGVSKDRYREQCPIRLAHILPESALASDPTFAKRLTKVITPFSV